MFYLLFFAFSKIRIRVSILVDFLTTTNVFFVCYFFNFSEECRFRDEDGEPLMDYDDDMNSDQEAQGQDHNLLDDNFEDEGWNRDRSPTPVHDDYKSKPRKRLIKKSSAADSGADFNLGDEDDGNYGAEEDDNLAGIVRDESDDGGAPSSSSGGGAKRKKFGKDSSGGERRKEKKRREGKGDKKFKLRKMGTSGSGKSSNQEGDPEMKEMWDTIAGDNSEVAV